MLMAAHEVIQIGPALMVSAQKSCLCINVIVLDKVYGDKLCVDQIRGQGRWMLDCYSSNKQQY